MLEKNIKSELVKEFNNKNVGKSSKKSGVSYFFSIRKIE